MPRHDQHLVVEPWRGAGASIIPITRENQQSQSEGTTMNITRHEYNMAIVALALIGTFVAFGLATTAYHLANAGGPIKVVTSDASR